ncbi:hypothetical protein CLPU_1c00100 [Gottschalkia purinilytica]|uniref:Uncharacterized protein n=1 Tax=Gottschalkia purinilytica TaxID=1503 RepID=A0A0L0WEJ4_GOTPU|nr:hypothetical protein [Gottschalkia purinilytica]KNF09845.1 hypothetical protein CLPU_1c00100 [Gottschalkia purinilytica]
MEHKELVKKLEFLVIENEELKLKNAELTKKIGEAKNWTGIREGEIIRRLQEEYGYLGPLGSDVANPISYLVRALLGVRKLTEINESNYEKAKEIAIDFTKVFCKYDWDYLSEMQKVWRSY